MQHRPLLALLAPLLALNLSCDRKPESVPVGPSEAETALNLQLEIERERLELERVRLEFDRDRAREEAARAREDLEAAKGEQNLAEARARAAEAERALTELNARENVAKAEREAAEKIAKADEAARARAEQVGKGSAPLQALPLHHQAPGYRPGPDYSLFYEQLAPHGSWFQTIEYGYVWQPEAARRDRGWRPYTVGRWLDTDQGWAWWSDEPFGWAAYHYGRWTEFDRIGWIWVPGPDWAPAWVSWRVGDSHIGWAPLPPVTVYETNFNFGNRTDAVCGIPPHHYTFIPTRAFVEPIHAHTLPPTQNVVLVQETVNVTHIHVREETVFVEGPRPEPLRRQFGERMPRHSIDRRQEWGSRGTAPAAPRREQGRLEFSAPRVAPAPESQARPSLLSGILEQLVPAHAVAKPDEKMVQNFVRERAKLIAPEAPAQPAGKASSAPSVPRPGNRPEAGKAAPKSSPKSPAPGKAKAAPSGPQPGNRPATGKAAPKSAPKSTAPGKAGPAARPKAPVLPAPKPQTAPSTTPVAPVPVQATDPVPQSVPSTAEPAPPIPRPKPEAEPQSLPPVPEPNPAPAPQSDPAPAEPMKSSETPSEAADGTPLEDAPPNEGASDPEETEASPAAAGEGPSSAEGPKAKAKASGKGKGGPAKGSAPNSNQGAKKAKGKETRDGVRGTQGLNEKGRPKN